MIGGVVFETGALVPDNPDRGLIGGGYSTSYTNVIQYITISNTGNSTDFGDLTVARGYLTACASTTRGVWAGGFVFSGSVIRYNTMDYVTIASTGDALDFGDLLNNTNSPAACNSSTRGVIGGGTTDGNTNLNVIQYITIGSTGNATDFGDLTSARYALAGCSSSTRGLFAGGTTGAADTSNINYITIASTGDAASFGSLTTSRSEVSGCSNSTRALFAGGALGFSNVIDYVTIASLGNATDFGDLITGTAGAAPCSNSTRAIFAGGEDSVGITNVIQYVTIATTGNAVDFGDLITKAGYLAGGCSSNNGGVQ